jgi:acetyltransferase-like isoleucine patch superfamily enzyme
MASPRVVSRWYLSVGRLWRRFASRLHSSLIGGAFAAFGPGTILEAPLRLSGESRIAVGRDVFVGAGSWLQTVGEGPVALEIGDGTSMSGSCVLSAAESVRIGRKVLFARNVYVSDHNHSFGDPTRSVIEQGLAEARPVEIGDGAWLGENVVVCPGVTIGRGAVVGANAVVLESIPEFAVAVGVPARVVRTYAPPLGGLADHTDAEASL